MEIRHSDEPLPDEDDIYGVNDINEYDSDYWLPDQLKRHRRRLFFRVVAAVVAISFISWVLLVRIF